MGPQEYICCESPVAAPVPGSPALCSPSWEQPLEEFLHWLHVECSNLNFHGKQLRRGWLAHFPVSGMSSFFSSHGFGLCYCLGPSDAHPGHWSVPDWSWPKARCYSESEKSTQKGRTGRELWLTRDNWDCSATVSVTLQDLSREEGSLCCKEKKMMSPS